MALFFSAGEEGWLWYRNLTKPPGTPPDWLFGPVWTVLYILMGIAAWRVWLAAGFRCAVAALGMFFVQLALNAAWTPLFFGFQRPGSALGVIVALLMAIIATLVLFARHDRLAAGLLTPYLLWVAYATYLNAGFWLLN